MTTNDTDRIKELTSAIADLAIRIVTAIEVSQEADRASTRATNELNELRKQMREAQKSLGMFIEKGM